VNDPLRAARESDEFLGDFPEFRLVFQHFPRQAVHLGRAEVDLLVRIDVEVDGAAGRPPVDQLDGGDFDDAMVLRVEAGGFGVEDQLPHASVLPREFRR
jgi:hypothetical protein